MARQLERHHLLSRIYTGYPRFKLTDEAGISPQKIHTFPWLQASFMARSKIGLNRSAWLDREWAWWAHETLDRYVETQLEQPTALIALSGSGLHSGRKSQLLGGIHICDRGSSHIRVQEALLKDEFLRYGSCWTGIDPRSIAKEEAEYQQANWISVPSQFCFDSFIAQGIPSQKLVKIPYGSRLERFHPILPSRSADSAFRVLFVGAAGLRKGILDLLAAFQQFSHPRKELILIGSLAPEAQHLLAQVDQSQITIVGPVANSQLINYYNQASVFLLPSIEEGSGMVIGEAMACGCPVISTTNTGASELITDGIEGFIVPIRSPTIIADRLQQLADEPDLLIAMGQASLKRVQQLGGWDAYGDAWNDFLTFKANSFESEP
ncbi:MULTISPECIES: glycosyltransferase family 4 protein [Synechococcales]|uniref:glycosyltransferase family 4 protein n=1 Tax=unclassified Synechococcus TaxID=2626047 RepID=UPI0021A62646|nr:MULTISPECIES: glycosyltransferase family 4 protein [unclassified Synechococcus]